MTPNNPLLRLGLTPRVFGDLSSPSAMAIVAASRSLLAQVIHPDRNAGQSSPLANLASTAADALKTMPANEAVESLRTSYRYLEERNVHLERIRSVNSRLSECQISVGKALIDQSSPVSLLGRVTRIGLGPVETLHPLDILTYEEVVQLGDSDRQKQEDADSRVKIPEKYLRGARLEIQQTLQGDSILYRWSDVRDDYDKYNRKRLTALIMEAIKSANFSNIPRDLRSELLQGFNLKNLEKRAGDLARQNHFLRGQQKASLKSRDPDREQYALMDRQAKEHDNLKSLLKFETKTSSIFVIVNHDGQVIDPNPSKQDLSSKFVGFLQPIYLEELVEGDSKHGKALTRVNTVDPKSKMIIVREVRLPDGKGETLLRDISVSKPSTLDSEDPEKLPYVLVKGEEKNQNTFRVVGRAISVDILD